MAVLIEANSVVVRAEAVVQRFAGGWNAFKSHVPNETLCADSEVARVGFMSPQDVGSFIKLLECLGLVHLREGQSVDIAVVEQMGGLASNCTWLEFGHIDMGDDPKRRVAACRLVGSNVKQLITPDGWEFEGSLSQTYGFAPSAHVNKSLKYLRHESGLDVYLNLVTNQEVFIGRTGAE